MRHLSVLSAILLASVASAQGPSPSPTPPTGQPPAPAPPPSPPGPMSNPPKPANPAAVAGSPLPAAPVSIKEGSSVDPQAARIHNVMVGGASSKLAFQPEAIAARPGDVIKFIFMDADNSVIQTTFEQPCAQKAGGFTAGPMRNATGAMPGPTQELKVENTDPLYMTSKAAGACGRGMLFVVNAPLSGDKSQAAFKMAAIKAGGIQFKQDALVVDQPVPQVASTVQVNPGAGGGNGGNVAAGQTPAPLPGIQGVPQNLPPGTVVAGQGTLGNGQPCGCNCLCGAGQPLPGGVAQGSFGGFAGVNPNAIGAMAPPPLGRQ